MGNLELYEKVRNVPKEAQKTINAGRLKGMTDINPMWRIKILTDQFGPCGIGWYYEVGCQWIEEVGEERVAFTNIYLYVKADGEWSKPIFGTGGSKLSTMETKGLYVSDECYKMATTDAISVACKNLGIGADVYWKEDISKYGSKPDADDSNTGNTEVPQNVADMKIAAVKVKVLTDKCKADGVPVEYILKCYKIEKLGDMTEKQFSQTVNNWNIVCEKAKLWNSQES